MSKSVDERIVDLQFNNKQFESNVADTIKSLQNLEKGLKLDGATKGLEDINKASKNFSIAGIADGVDHMASKFTAMSLVAITAIQNVVNKCIDAGVQIAKSLTLDPIMDGFREYETKMGAITTILTNTADKGTTLSDVTASLNELNEYADKTVYNFGQMTNSIGRFTANGVALDDSVKAIKGLANIAAGAGSNTMQMNSAMIQLSQSISNNRLMLQDWNSVVNAGMGGPVLQNMLMEAAVAAGEMDASLMNAVKNGEVGFRRLLDMGSTGFGIQFSRETMLAAFTQAAEDETLIKAATQVKTASQLMETMAESVGSSWATTWELVFGHRDQAIKLFTSINDSFGVMIQSSNDARNEALSFWNTYGGRDAMIEALANAFKALMSIIKPIGDAFKEIFPPLTGQRLAAFSKNLRDITRQFKVSDDMSDKLKRTFKGLFALVDIGIKIFGGFVKVAVGILKVLAPVGSGLLGFAAGIGDFIVAIRDAVSAGDIFNTVFGGIRTFLDKVADGIGKAIGKISDYFSQFGVIDLGPLRIFSKEVKVQFRPFTFIAEVMSKAFEAIKKVFEKVIPYFVKFGTAIGKAFAKIGEVVKAAANYLGFDSIGELVMSILKGGLLVGLMGLIDRIKSIVDSAGGFLSGITGILDGVRGSLEAFQSSLKAKALMSIAIAIGILAGALWVLATIPGRDLMTALGGITVLFGELSGVMLLMSHNIGSIKMGGIALQMIAISGAILILSFAMKNIADIGWENIAKGTLAIGAMMTMLVVAAKILGSNTETVIKGSFGMLMFSTSILILSQSLMLLSGLSWGELAGGLAGIGGLILELAVFMNLMGDGSGILKTGAAMILLGAGILVLAQAVKSMSGMSWEELGKGLTGLAGSLLIIAGVSKLVKPSQILALGAAMVGISAGLVVISLALSIMGGMEWEAIGKGLVAIGGSLLMIVAVAKLVNPVQLLAMAVALTIVSVALNLIGIALKIMGSMSWEQLAIGLIAMAGALIILAGAMYLMTGGLVGVAAMLVMAAAMMILVPALVLLGSMDLANVGIMLLALVGVFVIFAAAAILLTPVIPLMLLLAAALALLGGGMLALGSGMALLSGAMIVFAGAGAAGIAVLVEVVTSMIKLIPMAVDNIGKGLVLLLYRISEAIPQIVSIFREIFKGLLELFDEMLPPTVEAFYSFLEQMSQTLLDHVPQMVDNGMKLLVGVLKGIADNIDQVTQLSLKVVEEYLKGLTAGMPGVAKEGANLIIAFLKAMGEEVPRVIDAATQMVIDIINGIADTIDKRSEEIGRAGGRLAASLIKGIVNGIRAGNEESAKAMTEVADSIWASFKSFFGIHSPSTLMEEGGGNIMDGLELGIFGGKIDVENSAFQVGEGVETGVMDGASGLPTSMDEMMSGLSGNMSLDGFNVGETAGKGVTDGLNSTEGGLYDSGFNLGTAATDGFIDGFNLEFVGPMPSLPDIKKIISGYQSYSKTREAQHKKDVEQFNEEEYLKKKSASSMGQVAGAEKNAADIRAETQKKEFNAFVSWMDKRKKYGKLSLTEEMKLWAKLANTYADNAELETQATDKLYELEQRRLTRRKEISEEIRKSVKDFNESFADRTKSIYDSSRVQAKEVMSELDQLKAIDSQINSINDLKTEIDDLAKRRRELSKEELTATERDREQEKIDRRLVIAKKELKMAEKDLADTRKTAGYSAAQLQIEADKEALQSLKDQYRGRKALMEKGFSEEQISDMSKEQMAAMAKATDAELSEYHKIWDESQKYARLIAANELKGTRQEVLDNISKLHEEYKSLNIGKTFVQELYNGMHEEAPSITKLGTETGKFLGSGMASGLKSMSGALNSAGKEISEEAVEGVKASLKLTGKITEQDMNLAPTITPVVDMTEVDKGIANSFGHKKLGIASSADKAARATATDGNSGVINNNYRTENNDNRVTVQITNNNYVRNKDDIDKISKGLEKVVTKYNRSKGVKVS